MHYSLSGGEIDVSCSYTNNLDISLLGIKNKTLSQVREMFIDNSINKIGKNYKLIFDASNTTTSVESSHFDIVAKLDISNTYENPDISFIAGTDLSNFDIRLLDNNNNIIPFNAPLLLNTKQVSENNIILDI